MSVKFLKVKIKSLAAEARIIRLEERRAGKSNTLREQLYRHRTVDVRREQRASLLAYAFLRGRPLSAVEPRRRPEHVYYRGLREKRVAEIVKKFGAVVHGYWKPGDWEAKQAELQAWLAAEPAKV